jgi:hypothetical protein
VLHNLNGKLIFGFKTAMSLWNTSFSTALGISGPLFGQLQPHINRNRVLVTCQRAEHSHLAIVNLPQRPNHWRAVSTGIRSCFSNPLSSILRQAFFASP